MEVQTNFHMTEEIIRNILDEIEDAYLITGNIKHFLVKSYVVTPRKMIDIILENIQE